MKTQGTSLVARVSVSLLIGGLVVFWGFQASGKEWTEAQKEVWKSVEAVWENFKQGDVEAVMVGFHDDSVQWLAAKKVPLGKDMIEAHYRAWLSGPFKPVSYELEPLSIHIFGDVANVFYVYKWDREGVPSHGHGRSMQTYLKQDNKWMFIGGMGASCTKLPPCK